MSLKTFLLSFGLVLIYIRFLILFARYLDSNEITQLPENVFSGLTRLTGL